MTALAPAAEREVALPDIPRHSSRNVNRDIRSLDAEQPLREALAAAEAEGASDRIANALTQLGMVLRERGEYVTAAPLFDRALALYEAASDRPNISRALNNRASLLHVTGQPAEAEALYRRAITMARDGGVDPEGALVAASNLAAMLTGLGEYGKALGVLRDAQAWPLDEASRPRLGVILGQMGVVYRRLGQYDKAESVLVKAVTLRRAVLGAEHPDVAVELNNLGDLYSARELYGEALPVLREAVRLCQGAGRGWHCANMVNNLGSAEGGAGHREQAEQYFLEARKLAAGGHEQSLATYAAAVNNLGRLYADEKRYAEARGAFADALKAWESAGRSQHPDCASTLTNLAVLELTTRKPREAETTMLRALSIDEQVLGSNHIKVAMDRATLATILAKRKRYAEAEELLKLSLAVRERLEPEGAGTALANVSLGESLALQKKNTEAAVYFERAMRIWDRNPGTAPPNQVGLLGRYEQILRAMEEYGQAEAVAARAMRIRVKATIANSFQK